MAIALKNNHKTINKNISHLTKLENILLSKLKASDLDFICNSINAPHIPGLISISFKNILGETLLHRLDLKGILVSTGSACNSKKTEISHVIKELNIPLEYAKGTIRISLGKENTEDDIYYIANSLENIIKSLI